MVQTQAVVTAMAEAVGDDNLEWLLYGGLWFYPGDNLGGLSSTVGDISFENI